MITKQLAIIACGAVLGFFALLFEPTITAWVTQDYYHVGLFYLSLSAVFIAIFIWLRWGTRNWYETEGRMVDRRRALIPGNGPIIEYTDKSGEIKQGQASRVGFYSPKTSRIRVSPKGTIHPAGAEWLLVIPLLPLFLLGVLTLLGK